MNIYLLWAIALQEEGKLIFFVVRIHTAITAYNLLIDDSL